MQSQRLIYYKFGEPENVLKVEKSQVDVLKNDEILVQMHTRPINPSDLIPITGAYAHRVRLPAIPGYKGVGTVVDVGDSNSQHLLGKRVLPLRGEGTWQQYVKVPFEWAISIPSHIPNDVAAQLYINPLTAWITCKEMFAIQPGHDLLVNACGSSLGRIYAQLANIFGFRLLAVTRNDSYTEELLALGANHVINTSEIPLRETVMELTNGRGVHAAVDSIGGIDGTQLARCVRRNGTFLSVGLLSGQPINWTELTNKMEISLQMFHLRHWNERVSVQLWQATFQQVLSLISDNRLKLMSAAAYFNLEDVLSALQFIKSTRRNNGKVFLTS